MGCLEIGRERKEERPRPKKREFRELPYTKVVNPDLPLLCNCMVKFLAIVYQVQLYCLDCRKALSVLNAAFQESPGTRSTWWGPVWALMPRATPDGTSEPKMTFLLVFILPGFFAAS